MLIKYKTSKDLHLTRAGGGGGEDNNVAVKEREIVKKEYR